MEKQSNNNLIAHNNKRCIACLRMFRKKNSLYCFRCDPNKTKIKYSLPGFNKLTTVQGIRKAYCNLLNAIRKNRISRDEANTMFYGLKCFIQSLKDIIDMRIELDKSGERVMITDGKIEQLKALIAKLETLDTKFKQSTDPTPSGEIIQEVNKDEQS